MLRLTRVFLSVSAFLLVTSGYAQAAGTSAPPPVPPLPSAANAPAITDPNNAITELKLPDVSKAPPMPTPDPPPAPPASASAAPAGSDAKPPALPPFPSAPDTAAAPATPVMPAPAVATAPAGNNSPSTNLPPVPPAPGNLPANAPATASGFPPLPGAPETPTPVTAATSGTPAPAIDMNPETAPLPAPNGPLMLAPTSSAPATPATGASASPAAPALPGAPPDTSGKPAGVDASKIEPLPAPPGTPPLPTPPALPADNAKANPAPPAATAEAATKPQEKKAEAEEPLPETAKKKAHKKHKPAKHMASGAPIRHETATIKDRLPATIYRKSYDQLNQHLPKAFYEQDFSGLVFLTAAHDDLNGLRAVLDAGRSMELVDAAGDTPLLVAVKHNAINATRLLLARHANYNVTDGSGQTPLQIATQRGNFQIVHAIEAAAGTALAQE